jgi:LPS export ABC transporter protein LptC
LTPLRIFIVLALLGLGATAVWLAGRGTGAGPDAGEKGPAALAYNYEAEDVVLRQMDRDGRLQYQVEARQIRQEPTSGRIAATGVTLYRDPPDEPLGGPRRWTLTADRGELPADASVILLTGNVHGSGRPQPGRALLDVTTERLRYDPTKQEVTSDAEVAMRWGGITVRGRGLKANIRTGALALESGIHGTISP